MENMTMWNWLRNQVRLAVLAGVSDALQELDTGTDGQVAAVEQLRQRLQALPAPAPEPADVESNSRRAPKIA
jgi:hypothetical protein